MRPAPARQSFLHSKKISNTRFHGVVVAVCRPRQGISFQPKDLVQRGLEGRGVEVIRVVLVGGILCCLRSAAMMALLVFVALRFFHRFAGLPKHSLGLGGQRWCRVVVVVVVCGYHRARDRLRSRRPPGFYRREALHGWLHCSVHFLLSWCLLQYLQYGTCCIAG